MAVALLAEGVDRNKKPKDKTYSKNRSPSPWLVKLPSTSTPKDKTYSKNRSPSSRRAWIEI